MCAIPQRPYPQPPEAVQFEVDALGRVRILGPRGREDVAELLLPPVDELLRDVDRRVGRGLEGYIKVEKNRPIVSATPHMMSVINEKRNHVRLSTTVPSAPMYGIRENLNTRINYFNHEYLARICKTLPKSLNFFNYQRF